MLSVHLGLALLSTGQALAVVDEDCDQLGKPADYDDQVQRDFLSNYVALATTLSPVHAPVPHRAGHGAVGVELAGIPPLGCGQRMVEEWSKTEDTNKTPVVPRPRATFAFQPIGGVVFPYAGLALVPPVNIGGTRTLLASVELGAGLYAGQHLQLGARGHGTLQRTLGNVATAFVEGDEEVDDLYVASSLGLDLHLGWELESEEGGPQLTPYVSVGLVDVSTFFWIGDGAGNVPNNLHPYLGPAASLGVDALLRGRLRLGGELYAAPGGHSLPDPSEPTVEEGAFHRYGHLYTARLRAALEL